MSPWGRCRPGVALVVRPWFLTWGASAEEARSALPRDQIVPGPRTTGTPRDRDRGRPRRRLALSGGERNSGTTLSFPERAVVVIAAEVTVDSSDFGHLERNR